jgi:ribose transport system permease protein
MTAATMSHLGRGPLRVPGSAELQLALGTVVAVVVVGLFNSDYIGHKSLVNVLVSAAFVGIIALGEALVLLSGELDLSVGAVAAFSAVLGGKTMVSTGSITLGVLVTLATGAGFGVVNAVCVLVLRLPAFIATIGTMYIASGLAVYVTGGNPVYPLPVSFGRFGQDTLGGFTWMFAIFLLLGAAVDLSVRFTPTGRRLLATGGDAPVAAIAGIRVGLTKTKVFVTCSLIASLAGFLKMSADSVAQPTTGLGTEFTAITAAVVGGISIFGGSGSVLGAMIGAVFLSVIATGLPTTGLGTNWQNFATGVILIGAIGLDVARRRRPISP